MSCSGRSSASDSATSRRKDSSSPLVPLLLTIFAWRARLEVHAGLATPRSAQLVCFCCGGGARSSTITR